MGLIGRFELVEYVGASQGIDAGQMFALTTGVALENFSARIHRAIDIELQSLGENTWRIGLLYLYQNAKIIKPGQSPGYFIGPLPLKEIDPEFAREALICGERRGKVGLGSGCIRGSNSDFGGERRGPLKGMDRC
jgi:hypothetical protein